MNINSIITEWTYRLPKGYPTTDADYQILSDILQETTTLSASQRANIVNRAKGLSEQEDDDKTNTMLEFSDGIQFEQFIYDEYAMEGQRFMGLPLLYEKIQQSPNAVQLISIITDRRSTDLRGGEYKIEGLDAELYQLIRDTVKIPNGHYSELWFAIKFNGEVKGGVAGDSIVSDVDVGNDGVSLKDYDKISTVDFGNLTSGAALLLKTAVNSFEMLTGITINKSMTRDSINAVLDKLDSPELQQDISELIRLSKDTEITVIRRFVDKLQSFMPTSDPTEIVENFCNQLNNNINQKLTEVNWWGIINRGVLYLENSSEMMSALKCQNNRISPAIANFKGFHLFVNGNRINAAIKDLRAQEVGE